MNTVKWIISVGLALSLAGIALPGTAQDSDRGVGTLTAGEAEGPGSRRALVIGISDYHSNSLDLRYADDDARLFFDYLKNVEQIPEGQIDTLMNTDATASNIYGALRSLVETTEAGQLTYIYFAGHGDVVTQFYGDEGYFLASDANDQREYNGTGGSVEFAHLNKAVDAIIGKEGKVVLVLDACRAGYVVNEDGANKTLASLNSGFQNTTKFLSSQAAQKSYESEEIGHGYFTYYLTLGMMGAADAMPADNELQYFELAQFLNQNVKNETTGKQTPVVQDRDLFRPYRTVSTEEKQLALNALQQSASIKNMIASRDAAEPSTRNRRAEDPLIRAFNRAIQEKNYYGDVESAYYIYRDAVARENYPKAVKEQMRQTLINILATRSQLVINSYIGGEEPLPHGSDFEKAANDLSVSLEIMDEQDYNHQQLATSERFLRGYAIIRNKDYQNYGKAKQYLEEAIELQPRAAYIHNALGILYNHEEDFANARTHYSRAAELIPTWAFPVNNLGSNFLDQRNYLEALRWYDSSKSLDTEYSVPFNNSGVVLERLGKYMAAEQEYREAIRKDATDPIATKNLGDLYEKRGNLKTAEEYYERALALDSSYVYTYYRLAEFHYENSLDIDYAEELLLKAIELQPYFAEGYVKLADFYRRESRNPQILQKADSLYAKAIALDPYNTWSYAGRAWLSRKLGQDEAALYWFSEGVRFNPGKPDSYYYLGNYYFDSIKEYDLALVQYNRAIEQDSLYLPAYEKLVELYSSQDQPQEALQSAERIVSLNHEAPDTWKLLGNLHFENGRHDKAIEAYRQTIRLDSTYAKGYVNLAYSLVQKGEYDEAEGYFSKAAAYNPYKNKPEYFADYLTAVAGKRLRVGDANEAGEALSAAYALQPDHPRTLRELMEFNYLQGAPQQAREYGQQLVEVTDSRSATLTLLNLYLKVAIDLNDAGLVDRMMRRLEEISSRNDQLLAMLAYHVMGDRQKAEAAREKINPAQLSERYLKRNYSDQAIDLIFQLTGVNNEE